MSQEAAGGLSPLMEAAGVAEARPLLAPSGKRLASPWLFARAMIWLIGEYARIGALAAIRRVRPAAVLELPAARPHSRRAYFAAKRAIDIVVGTLALVALLPAMLVIAIAVAADSRGSVLFVQERVGKKGRLFRIYKFRSMVATAPKYSAKVATDDPRITRVGRFLRASGLDELPQFVNVLKGEMTLVGPRPEQPFIVEEYEPWQRARLEVTPGITGWWQIHHRESAPMQQWVSYDLDYIATMGARMDFRIAVGTVRVMAAGAWRVVRGRAQAA